MTNEEIRELERWISEAIEPWNGARLKGSNGIWRSIHGNWTTGPGYDSPPAQSQFSPRPWATDETANAMLLEMMPYPQVGFIGSGQWLCYADYHYPDTAKGHSARKLAICLAFKAWKEKQ